MATVIPMPAPVGPKRGTRWRVKITETTAATTKTQIRSCDFFPS